MLFGLGFLAVPSYFQRPFCECDEWWENQCVNLRNGIIAFAFKDVFENEQANEITEILETQRRHFTWNS